MQFVFDDGLYKVARITGPQHNFLAIRLANAQLEKLSVLSLPTKAGDKVNVMQEDVHAQVRSGLAFVSQEVSKQYFVAEVQFVPSDTYSPDVYQMLVIELIRKIDSGWSQ